MSEAEKAREVSGLLADVFGGDAAAADTNAAFPAVSGGEATPGADGSAGSGDGHDPNPALPGLPGEGATGAGEAGAAPEGDGGPLTPKSIAERLGVTPEDLYAMEITTGDGQTATLHDLKNSFAAAGEAERGTALREAELDRREAGFVSDQVALGVLTAMNAVPQEVQSQAAEFMQGKAEEGYRNFLTLAPEMKDDATRIAFEDDLNGLVKRYGVNQGLISTLNALDPNGGLRLMMRDVLRMQKRFTTLEREARPKPPRSVSPQGRGRPNGDAASIRNARHGSEADKVSAVSRLLGG